MKTNKGDLQINSLIYDLEQQYCKYGFINRCKWFQLCYLVCVFNWGFLMYLLGESIIIIFSQEIIFHRDLVDLYLLSFLALILGGIVGYATYLIITSFKVKKQLDNLKGE